MRWAELAFELPRELAEGMSADLMDLGAVGTQEDSPAGEVRQFRQPWDRGPGPAASARVLLRAWFPAEDAPVLREVIPPLLPASASAPRWSEIGEEDWGESWKQSFHRIAIDDRLGVAPPWEAQPGDVIIEPGMAFGTGEHPTTRAILTAIARLARPGGACLDVGTGSGVLALAAARLGMRAWGVDNDPDAVRTAVAAAALNALDVRFDDTPLDEIPGTYDLVVANLYAEVLAELAPALISRCAGHLALAGILADRAHLVTRAFRGLRLVEQRQDGDWVSLVYAR